jgi:hypothetical protein
MGKVDESTALYICAQNGVGIVYWQTSQRYESIVTRLADVGMDMLDRSRE